MTIPSDFFSQLSRSVIGSDLFLQPSMASNGKIKNESKYPPCNVLKNEKESTYIISMAVAGFSRDELSVEIDCDVQTNNRVLVVSGKKNEEENSSDVTYLCKDIATRDFNRRFKLASEFLEVTDVTLKDGLLTVTIFENKPNKMEPYKLTIN